jgi:UDP-N-acetylmuramate dehydrogenase
MHSITTLIQNNCDLRAKTTMRVGGCAQYYCEPSSTPELVQCLQWAQRSAVKIFVLGRGSNVIISDAGWEGLVINMAARYSAIAWDAEQATVLSGTSLHQLVMESTARGLGGIEQLAGIPGTVGGAAVMNAGAFEQCFSDVLYSVDAVTLSDAAVVRLHRDELDVGYRQSIFANKELLVLGVCCRFTPADAAALSGIVSDIMQRRKAKQPLQWPNCGSVFKNPPNKSAGRLIEACGLKGMRMGGMEVSTQHANFMINRGDASAQDVHSLVGQVQRIVLERQGVLLEPEVIFIGTFDSPLLHEQG